MFRRPTALAYTEALLVRSPAEASTKALRLPAPFPSPARGGGGYFQLKADSFQHCGQVLQHFVVPKPQHPVTPAPKPFVSSEIIRPLLRVLPAVHLDDETALDADEV